MLGTAEIKEKLFPCWQLMALRTSVLSSAVPVPPTRHSGLARAACKTLELSMALRKSKQAQTLHPGIAQGGSQQ